MDSLEIIMIALGLSMDAFALSLAAGAAGYTKNPHSVFRISFHHGLFQFLMPVAGYYLGRAIVGFIQAGATWAAFGLLAFVGGRMVWAGLHPEDTAVKKDPSKGLTMVMLSLAASIDAMAVGLSLAMLGVSIWYPAVIIGIITTTLCLLAIALGHRLSARFGSRMELMGGLVLVAIAVKIVIMR